jgi:hypothetical protein
VFPHSDSYTTTAFKVHLPSVEPQAQFLDVLAAVAGGSLLTADDREPALLQDAKRRGVVPCHVGKQRARRHQVQERRERLGRDAPAPVAPAEPVAYLVLGALDEATAARLEAESLTLNPAALRRRLTDNEKKLARMCSLKMQTRRKEVAANG